MNPPKSPEREAYEGYVAMCRRLHVAPMEFERWSQTFGKVSPKQGVIGMSLKGRLSVVS